MFQITKGASLKPIKAVVFGPEGVGKTTFGASWPGAVFIDVEDGSGHYDVARLPKPQTWNALLDEIMWCAFSDEVGTVVIDTADAAEKLCREHILDRDSKESIEGYGYGKGYTILAEELKKLIECLDACISEGKHVLVLAHAQIKKFEQPDEMGSYDRWELKLEKKCAPLLKEWCDLLLFANFKTDMVKDENGKYRAAGGKRRVMYASHTAAYDAKNRLGLPDEMPFEFAQIAEKVTAPQRADAPKVAEPPMKLAFTDATPPEVGQLHSLMERDGISQAQVQRAVGEGVNNPYTDKTTFGEYDVAFIRDVLIGHWGQIVAGIREREAYEAPVPFD